MSGGTDLDRHSFKQIITSCWYAPYRSDARHGEANRGNVCRCDHGDVENDYDSDEERGPFSGVKRRIKILFTGHRMKREICLTGSNAPFSDFINRG